MKQTVFSGMQPTGSLHIGNYLGALKNWVEIQNSGQYETIFFIADLHSLTVAMDAKTRAENTRMLAAEYIAAGVDPKKSILFIQSHVPEHTELAWIFNCVTPIAELERMTQFKDKSQKNDTNINAGLFTYPVLQAADILLYKGTLVPVGKDQEQHLELSNDIARWFNNRFGEFFSPIKYLPTETPKVMSLLEPTKKMSKSMGENHYVGIADEPSVILAKLKKAVTATAGGGGSEGVKNLLGLLKQFGDKKVHAEFDAAELNGTIRYGDLKATLAEAIAHHFAEFRAKRAELLTNPKKLDAILEDGAKRASVIAQKTMRDIKKLVGIE